jgi:trehalose 6-phosphate phosphatase
MNRKPWKAVILDMDGVITQTARVHARAWKRCSTNISNDGPLEGRTSRSRSTSNAIITSTWTASPATTACEVSWRPGASRSRTATRGKSRTGTPFGVGQSQERDLSQLAARGRRPGLRGHGRTDPEVEARGTEDRGDLLQPELRSRVESGGLLDVFDAKVDGNDVAELGLSGKPSPDIFLRAAQQLGVEPNEALVIEDAISGVEAGRRGEFGWW